MFYNRKLFILSFACFVSQLYAVWPETDRLTRSPSPSRRAATTTAAQRVTQDRPATLFQAYPGSTSPIYYVSNSPEAGNEILQHQMNSRNRGG